MIDAWVSENRASVSRCDAMLADLKQADGVDVAMLSVALREIRTLAQARRTG
jgi:NAD-specific glutamate dehydrogenase